MPKQHVVLGRNVPQFGARRRLCCLVVCVCVSIFVAASLLFFLPGTIPSDYTDRMPKIEDMAKLPGLPDLPDIKNPFADSVLNPFKQPAHPPPRQKNDTYGQSSWWADWKWLHVPFSSSLTLDDERSLLPPLKVRPAIYCYYDVSKNADPAVKDAESDLLLTWRRAWWAHGFRPMILSHAEAISSPLHDQLQRQAEVKDALRGDMMRYLAWGAMGGGLLAHYTTLPMGPRDDPLLSSFRRGEYPKLTRWMGLGHGLLSGPEADIHAVINGALAGGGGVDLTEAQDVVSAAPERLWNIDGDKPKAVACYDEKTVDGKYAKVADAALNDRADGLRSLDRLINSHLHATWQNRFSDGIAVLKPLPHHSTHMVADARRLAHDLALSCLETPMPASCPPNNVHCRPCKPQKHKDNGEVTDANMRVSTLTSHANSSSAMYTIGTVPHPYTLAVLSEMSDGVDISWIRRELPRDPWLAAVTKDILGDLVGPAPRVLRFKQLVAKEAAAARSIWLTAEKPLDGDANDDGEDLRAHLDWHFGFRVPVSESYDEDKHGRPTQDHDPERGSVASGAELDAEQPLLRWSRDVVAVNGLAEGTFTKDKNKGAHAQEHKDEDEDKVKDEKAKVNDDDDENSSEPAYGDGDGDGGGDSVAAVRAAAEAWSMADTEAWNFARAFLARRVMERKRWEEEESRYVGGSGSEGGRQRGWAERWRDEKKSRREAKGT